MDSVGTCGPALVCTLPPGEDPGYYDGPGTCEKRKQPGESCSDDGECVGSVRCLDGTCQTAPLRECQ